MNNQVPFGPNWQGNPNLGWPNFNQGGCQCREQLNRVDSRLNRLERQVQRLENRVTRLERGIATPFSTSANDQDFTSYPNNSNMYMM